MKKVIFPATFRGHLARQKLLLDELKKYFEVRVWEPKVNKNDGMSVSSIFYSIELNNLLNTENYELALVRGDRYELLPVATTFAYRGIPIAHIEGGDLSSVIDNRVRHAITHLSDFHFCTNEESHARLISMGISPKRVWNYGSLDVEFAACTEPKKLKENPYILVSYHPIDGEKDEEVAAALSEFSESHGYEIVTAASNKDYGRQYGTENYSPEDYINLMRFASCCVGNSSSFLKEASILGVPVVNVGSRQNKRLKPKNVIDVPCERNRIKLGIEFQTKGNYESDFTYFQAGTSNKIAAKLNELI